MQGAADPQAPGAGVVHIRVRYPETDRMQVAYHGHYLVWFELGRTELMRGLGCPYSELEERLGISFPVTEVGARYHASARYDDLLDVHTELAAVGGVRVRFDYRVVRPADHRLIAHGFTEHAAVNRVGKPTRLPAELRLRLAARCRS